eukprot:7849258-Lingulodinium_polyedra.AAC.1
MPPSARVAIIFWARDIPVGSISAITILLRLMLCVLPRRQRRRTAQIRGRCVGSVSPYAFVVFVS